VSFYFLDSAARSAWLAATTQQAQLEALAALWSGDVWAKFYSSAGTHLATVTYGTPTIDTGTTPRAMVLGAWSAEAHYNPGTATYCILQIPSGADIVRADSTWDAADPTISDPGGRVRLDIGTTLRVQATAGLPATDTPAWLVTADPAVNEIVAIAGTGGAGGAPLDAFSGVAAAATRLVSAGAGGHGSGLDNRVVDIDLADDAPGWGTLMAASVSGTNDVAYYPDGKPCSRHTYHFIHPIAGNKVLLGGCRFTFNGALDLNAVDAFDLDVNEWDGVVAGSPGTSGSGWPDLTPSGYYLAAQDGDGNLWSFLHTTGAAAKLTVATKTWSSPIASPVSPSVRYPWAWDSTRAMLFGLAVGDGEGSGTDVRAVRQIGITQTAITFNSSAAYTQFQADAGSYAGMAYDPVNDKFLWYSGQGSAAGRIYVITPNSGTVWDMAILTTSGDTLPASSALVKKWHYMTLGSIGGIAIVPTAASDVHFLRLS